MVGLAVKKKESDCERKNRRRDADGAEDFKDDEDSISVLYNDFTDQEDDHHSSRPKQPSHRPSFFPHPSCAARTNYDPAKLREIGLVNHYPVLRLFPVMHF